MHFFVLHISCGLYKLLSSVWFYFRKILTYSLFAYIQGNIAVNLIHLQ